MSTCSFQITKTFHCRLITVSLPPTDHLAWVESSLQQSLVLSGSATISLAPSSAPRPWPLYSSHFPDNGLSAAASFLAGSALAICDGSYMSQKFPGLAAAAWIIHPGMGTPAAGIPCHGVTQVHGAPTVINSYRTELQGLHALLLAINHICSIHHVQSGQVIIGCDNQGVLHHTHSPSAYVPSTIKHADLVCAIHATLHLCPLHLTFQYVAGHQDDFCHFEDLPTLAQLNVQADHMAKQALHVLGEQSSPALLDPLPGLSWWLAAHQQPISSEPRVTILNHLSAQTAIPYWIARGHLTGESATLVDWPLLAKALSSRPPTYRMWLSKFASGHSAVGITMHRWKQWDSPLCPICHLADEDINHVILCSNAERTAHWHSAVDTFGQWLSSAKTHPAIHRCLITTLHG